MDLEIIFENAFDWRKPPSNVLPENITIKHAQLDSLYGDAYYFRERHWKLFTLNEINSHSDLLFGSNPYAACYFLPGIFFAVYREKILTSIVIDYALNPLLLGYEKLVLNSYNFERYLLLNQAELSAIKQWINWYYDLQGMQLDEYVLICDTLDLLISSKLSMGNKNS